MYIHKSSSEIKEIERDELYIDQIHKQKRKIKPSEKWKSYSRQPKETAENKVRIMKDTNEKSGKSEL